MSSSNGHRRRGRVPYMNGKSCAPVERDADAPYSREQLIRFDDRFRARLLHAFETGKERRQSAAMNGANASRALEIRGACSPSPMHSSLSSRRR
jgi:hypothetical protein